MGGNVQRPQALLQGFKGIPRLSKPTDTDDSMGIHQASISLLGKHYNYATAAAAPLAAPAALPACCVV